MTCVQQFPRSENGRIARHRWQVDTKAARRFFSRARSARPRLEREVEEMTRHLPRWVLTVAVGRERVVCRCGGMLVFDRGLRCVQCERTAPGRLPRGARLAWFGLLPPIGLDGLSRIHQRLVAQPPLHHVVGHRDDLGDFLLVPLVALYPAGFPKSSVQVAYLPGFFRIPGTPRPVPSHRVHLLSDGVMCLFAGDWRREMTCRDVLQQRAYPHVIKMLNYANGKRSAFNIVS